MDVIAHETPGMYSKTFVHLTVPKTAYYYITIILPGEHIDPTNNGESHKMDALFISDLIPCSKAMPQEYFHSS